MNVYVLGDGTFLSLIDCARYESFVGDWAEGHRLLRHLISQHNKGAIMSWGTGFETDWVVEVRHELTEEKGFREFLSFIECSTGTLHLANFDSLTMAAQFENHVLPDAESSNCRIDLPPGQYQVRVVQLVDPSEPWWEEIGDRPQFLLEFGATKEPGSPSDDVPWAEYL